LEVDPFDDEELVGWLEEARGTFAVFEEVEWLSWGGEILMVEFAKVHEVSERLRELEEEKRRGLEKQKAELAEAEAERAKLLGDFVAKKISRDEFRTRVASIGTVAEGMGGGEGAEEGDDEAAMVTDTASSKAGAKEKRKREGSVVKVSSLRFSF
jgi:hypothetical protein